MAARIKVVLLTGAGVGKPEQVSAQAEPAAAPEAPAIPPARESEKTPVEGTDSKTAAADSQPAEPAIVAEEKIALSPALWLDPDVRWLTGVHEAGGHSYLVRELYEELLWWLLMPSLLRLAGEPAPSRAAVLQMSRTVEEALETAEAAGYRIDALLGKDVVLDAPEDDAVEEDAAEAVPETAEPEQPEIGGTGRVEPEIEAPAATEPDPVKPE